MAGIKATQVYLPTPDQSKTVGAVATAPVGTAKPTSAGSTLPAAWTTGGYIDENGLSMSISKSTTLIKDWSQSVVRKAISDYDGTLSLSFLQMDEFAAETLFGSANVTVTAATVGHGEQIEIGIGPDMPPIQAFCFSMKDGDARIRVYVPQGQVTETGDVSFVPGAGNVYPCTISTYDDGTGHSIYVMYDDGVVLSS